MPEDDRVPAETGAPINKNSLITILICVAISMFFMRSGFLSFFFLVPLGYAVMATGSVFFTFIAASITNIILDIGLNFSGIVNNAVYVLMDIIYFTALFFGFLWIIGGKNIRTVYRFMIASIIGTLAFLLIIFRQDSLFFLMFTGIADELFPGLFTMDILEVIKSILLRGGALVSVIFMYFINRQLAIYAFRLIKKQRNTQNIVSFYAPANAIWVFSGALATVILSSVMKIEILEIIAWNVFIICVIVFMTQGAGILMHFLAPQKPALRIGVYILIIVVLFTPVNIVVLAALLLLGIIENWRPFRKLPQK